MGLSRGRVWHPPDGNPRDDGRDPHPRRRRRLHRVPRTPHGPRTRRFVAGALLPERQRDRDPPLSFLGRAHEGRSARGAGAERGHDRRQLASSLRLARARLRDVARPRSHEPRVLRPLAGASRRRATLRSRRRRRRRAPGRSDRSASTTCRKVSRSASPPPEASFASRSFWSSGSVSTTPPRASGSSDR